MRSREGSTVSTRAMQLALALVLIATASVVATRPASVAAVEGLVVPAGGVLRVPVPEAVGGKSVIGQLTVDGVVDAGFVTAFGCDQGIPKTPDGIVARSDLNYDGRV